MSFIEFTGTARLDRRTKRLVKRLGPDDIAIIDHTDLDRVSAEELAREWRPRRLQRLATPPRARYPNPGPLALVRAGVVLIDVPGAELFDEVSDGEALVVRGATSIRTARGSRPAGRSPCGSSRTRSSTSRVAWPRRSRASPRTRCASSARKGSCSREGIELPQLRTRFRDRHALVVARGPELQARPPDRPAVHPRLQARARRRGRRRGRAARGRLPARPDRGRHGLRLGQGARHAAPSSSSTPTRTGAHPGASGSTGSGCLSVVVPVPGISEDVAMLLAYEKGAELIVAVGTHFNLSSSWSGTAPECRPPS